MSFTRLYLSKLENTFVVTEKQFCLLMLNLSQHINYALTVSYSIHRDEGALNTAMFNVQTYRTGKTRAQKKFE